MKMARVFWTVLWVGSLSSTTVFAAQFGKHRALQHGSIGDSPQFIEIEKYDGEAAVTLARRYGDYKLNNDVDTKTNMTDIESHVLVGGGIALSKQMALTAYADINLIRDFDLVRDRIEVDQRYDSGLYEHEFMGFMV